MSAELTALHIDELFSKREFQIPTNSRNFLRKTWTNGELAQILQFQEPPVNKPRGAAQRLEDEFKRNVKILLTSDNKHEQSLSALCLAWVLYGKGELLNEEKISDINEVYDIWPEEEDYLLEKAPPKVAALNLLIKEATAP